MKHLSLFFFLLFLSVSSFVQVWGQPPCGFYPAYACDNDGDGFATFNLVEGIPFSTFCTGGAENPENYSSITFYVSSIDSSNETNPILNPEAYENIVAYSQSIYYRVNAINSGANFNFLSGQSALETSTFFAKPLSIEVYDNDSDGMTEFDLTSVNLFCDSSVASDYNISFYLSGPDASNGIDAISNPSNFQNSSNPQFVFVRTEHTITGEIETNPIELKALFAVVGSIPDVYACDSFDLSTLDSTVLGDLNSDYFTVSYYLSQVDAENETNVLPNIFNTQADVTVFCRVEENTKGSYAITSFSFYISKTSLIAPLESYKICDENGDGKATFDLASIRNKIIQDANYDYFDISFNLYSSDTSEGLISNQDSYINITNPQTIYVDIEDWGGYFDCYVILPLELIVQDCTTKGVIEINAFYDEDENTTFENDEINFLNGVLTYEKNNDGVLRNLYSSNGIFNIISDDENDTYDISYDVLAEYDACYDITTNAYEDITVSNGSTVSYDFPVTKNFDCGDIAVYITSYVPPRPGFDYKNYLIVQNKGLETVPSGTIEFTMDAALTLNSVSGVDSGNTVTNTSSSGFNLNFVNLEPNGYEIVYVNMNVPIPTSLGTVLTNTATYSVNDLDAENNTSTLSEVVIGSYDPNDINESHGPEILHSSFTSDDYLYYTIRFQNVGTADAINISIDNTLDTQLDESTIQMLSSSHTNVFTQIGSQLNWQFDNIHLPSEDDDEPNSHGYVYYKIKPKAGYAVGDIIPNTAEIYFDFNPAVITNTFETEFITTLSGNEIKTFEFSIFPNPSHDIVKLNFNKSFNALLDVAVYDIQGKQIISKAFNNVIANFVELDLNQLSKGIYFIKVNNSYSEITKKIIIN